ncbi:uncharacterized protein LOC125378395 [Haliotis rufescens]|uniref:uncharacterized protein LOC125378395 n=1 Tax=Haliotis rufescens TaxID=6454 RepID=UPI00201ED054|nr:uncharacterized protein LOC125378395 [Haliotis rufescens]
MAEAVLKSPRPVEADLKKPANCSDLNTPEINKLIWDSLQSDTCSMDVKMQRVQSRMIKELNLRRKELIKPQLNYHYRALCTPSSPKSSDYLFEEDVAKHLKDIAMSTRLGHKATSYGHGRGRGWHRYQPYPYAEAAGVQNVSTSSPSDIL